MPGHHSSDEITLVTGGSGALGVPLVAALAEGGATVVSHARGPQPRVAPGVRAVSGDILAGATLGMNESTAADLRSRVTTIVHAAALTRFDAALDGARQTNLAGTAQVLGFAAQCPRLARFCALSTVYVAGRRTGTILEPELEHDRGFVNNYEQSKYEAEQLLRHWMPRLPIAICRVSTTLGDSASGRVDRPAAIHQAIRFLHHSLLPMIPGSPESPVDVIPTDYAVAAVGHLAGSGFVAGATFHISAGTDAPREDELIDLTVDTFLEHRPAWRRRAIEKPVIVALDTFELFRRSVEEVADSALAASVGVLGHFAPQLAFPKTFDDENCRTALAQAGIHRPPVRDTLVKVVKYLLDHDWGTRRPSGAAV
jgi:nucleoside-diphosphate-sugar epimerase